MSFVVFDLKLAAGLWFQTGFPFYPLISPTPSPSPFVHQVMIIGELSRNFKGDYVIGRPSSPFLSSLCGT